MQQKGFEGQPNADIADKGGEGSRLPQPPQKNIGDIICERSLILVAGHWQQLKCFSKSDQLKLVSRQKK